MFYYIFILKNLKKHKNIKAVESLHSNVLSKERYLTEVSVQPEAQTGSRVSSQQCVEQGGVFDRGICSARGTDWQSSLFTAMC